MFPQPTNLPDRLIFDSLLYADDVKFIAPRNRHYILQNSLNISVSLSRDWELDLNPIKSEHLLIGNPPHFFTHILSSHDPPNSQTMQTVTTTKNLGTVLNTGLSAEDNVVSAVNKTHRMCSNPRHS